MDRVMRIEPNELKPLVSMGKTVITRIAQKTLRAPILPMPFLCALCVHVVKLAV